jgi:hypothetical protein
MTFRARVIDALPPYGEPARGFSATGLGLHAQGLVVEFWREDGVAWIGNFVCGLTDFDCVESHPNARAVLVIAGGQGYIIDPERCVATETFGGGLREVFLHPAKESLVFDDQGIRFLALGSNGWLWKSRRVSWDGFRNLRQNGEIVMGEAWAPPDTWEPFAIDLNTGDVIGGSYPMEVPND